MSLKQITRGYRDILGKPYKTLELRRDGTPSAINVLFFEPEESDRVPDEEWYNYLCTVGLSTDPMPGSCPRAELVINIDGRHDEESWEQTGRRLASMAAAARDDAMGLAPGMLLDDVDIPLFNGMTCALVTDFDWGSPTVLEHVEPPTRLLSIYPIFASEAAWIEEVGVEAAQRVFFASSETLEDPSRSPVELTAAALVETPADQPHIDLDRSVPELWEAIEAWLEANAQMIHGQLQDGATSDELSALRDGVGVALPEDYVASLTVHNGKALLNEYEYLDVEGVLGVRQLFVDALDRGDFDGREVDPANGDRLEKVWWSRGWIPFAEDNDGNSICIDMTPGPDGHTGQIVYYDYEEGPRVSHWGSFHEWLTRYLLGLEQGDFEVEDDGYIYTI